MTPPDRAADPQPSGADGADPRVAIVTGGGRGIGALLSEALADDGYSVALVGRDAAALRAVADSLPTTSLVLAADVSSPGDVAHVVDDVLQTWGQVDLLVNNAGVRDQRAAAPWLADVEDWWRVLEVNLRGVMLMTSAVLPPMLARGRGRVVDLGSGIGLRAEPRYSAYSVSKAAALRWVDNVAVALGEESPVRVVAVSPGLVRTDMTAEMWEESDAVEYGDPAYVTTFVRQFAAGRLDHLHGRFVHAVKDAY